MVHLTPQWKLAEPDYMTLWSFERDFDAVFWSNWFNKWGFIAVPISLVYVTLVFYGKSWMCKREPYKLQTPLLLWNIGLALMSILIALRVAPELFVALRDHGIHATICEFRWKSNGATAFWGIVMLFSKIVELGDTAFVVLRKQRLLFLHWYHHTMTLSGWWLVAGIGEPVFLWFGFMNAVVHSFMYSYYAIKALRFKLHPKIAMFVTSLQLIQMVMAVVFSTYSAVIMKLYGDDACPHRDWWSLKLSFTIYTTYAVLFAKLFLDYYVFPSSSRKGGKVVMDNRDKIE